ncbi:von Willebrand factor D and EGF domain-containing protein-like isoform X1 [Mytilus galloprovincialis]|uniref:von Willebrand factor D and EGF domain-containing protein-like isoform X1 n=1 Tax=Mytilus galloprovincialis TaxID=29158 RepID=UPI003F7C397C
METILTVFVLLVFVPASENSCCWRHGGCYSKRCYQDCCWTRSSTEPNMLALDGYRLYLVNRNDSTVTKLVVGLHTDDSIDYHHSKSYIYTISSYYGTMHRVCYPCYENERQPEIIVEESSPYHPHSFAIDSDNDHIYWSDYQYEALIRSDLNGLNKTVILENGKYGAIGYIALDLNDSWIYFMNASEGTIDRCGLDGNNTERVLIDNYMTTSSRITLDILDRRIYWTIGNTIKSATFDGTGIKEVQRISHESSYYSINGIAVYNDYLYYSDNWSNYRYVYRVNKYGGTRQSIARLGSSVRDIKIFHGDTTKDPCRSYTTMINVEKRSKDFVVNWTTDGPINDAVLEKSWYKINCDSYILMPVSPPGAYHCGTDNPIWLNGTLPNFAEGNVTREACMQTNSSVCEISITIEIRNCDGYYIYYLQPTPYNSSYCFGSGPVKCPSGTSSETEYYPGCSSNFPNDYMAVEVKAILEEGDSFPIPGLNSTPSLEPIFKCDFDDKSNGTHAYDVFWLICGGRVKENTSVLFEDIDNVIFFKESDWSHRYRMNMELKCAIRRRNTIGSTPGPYLYSQVLRAGLNPHGTRYTVFEGESINITFTATVPVGCVASHENIRKHCDQNFYISAPEYVNNGMECTNSVVKRNIVFKSQFCGIRLGSLDWHDPRTVQVYGYSDGLYNLQDRRTYIRLSAPSASPFNDIWRNVNIPSIEVKVVDKDAFLTNSICQIYNDPHVITYDGKYYEYMDVGEFVIYRNDIGPYWVHALLTSCGFGWPGSSCLCGIAIRSHDSLFVLRTCKKISRREKHLLRQPVVTLDTCDEKDILVENIGNKYKVTLPIGTEIRFEMARRLISLISIKPSVYDIQAAKGLCGVPSKWKDSSDDFTHRNDGPISNDQLFADSWRIRPYMINEQLFTEHPQFERGKQDGYSIVVVDTTESNTHIGRFCACKDQASSTDSVDDFYTLHCNLTESTEQCTESAGSSDGAVHYASCSQSFRKKRSLNFANQRRRRSVDEKDDNIDFGSLIYDEDVNDTGIEPPKTFRNGWTADRAYQTCYDSIKNAVPENVYNKYVDVPVNSYVKSCVSDIELTGDTTFLQDTINAMITFIMTELVKTEKLYLTRQGSETVLEYVTGFLCPNQCSSHGKCKSGVCTCDREFIGEDCSYNISVPPSDTSLPFDGLCTLRSRACRSTNILGDFLSSTVWCKIKYFQIFQETVLYKPDEDIFLAEYRNLYMVTLELPLSRKKRSANGPVMSDGYDISLSYDGIHFGDNISMIIFDDQKYSCNVSLKTCVSLNDSPEDNDVVFTVVPATVCVVVVFVLVIGAICYKLKNPKSKIGSFDYKSSVKPDTQMFSIENWTTRENTVSDLQLDFDEDKTGDCIEVYEKQFPPNSHLE